MPIANPMHFADSLLTVIPLFAASGPSPSLQWGIVGFMAILGLLVTLSPPRRTYEVKKPKDE
jgi:hypothetical protein